ncbi:MAG: glutaminase [Muribaculaceae bacterium]|nr:glutaminase [Muribaculaceae bacterium]
MERKISLSQVQKAVEEAYENVKDLNDGAVDSRLDGVDASKFGIVIELADGSVIEKGDVDVAAPLGSIVTVPVASILLSQDKFVKEAEKGCGCGCGCKDQAKPRGSVKAKLVRGISAIEPVGDFDSKWNFLENRMIDMMGDAPELDEKLYKALKAENEQTAVVNQFAETGYFLFDDAAKSVDLAARAMSMKASARQVAAMGATIAADGVNPRDKKIVFDGAITPALVARMALSGKKFGKKMLLKAGIPAKKSFGGLVMGVVPGVMSIAAYSPMVNDRGASVKAVRAIVQIMNKLQINVFGSARIVIE